MPAPFPLLPRYCCAQENKDDSECPLLRAGALSPRGGWSPLSAEPHLPHLPLPGRTPRPAQGLPGVGVEGGYAAQVRGHRGCRDRGVVWGWGAHVGPCGHGVREVLKASAWGRFKDRGCLGTAAMKRTVSGTGVWGGRRPRQSQGRCFGVSFRAMPSARRSSGQKPRLGTRLRESVDEDGVKGAITGDREEESGHIQGQTGISRR